MAAEHAHEAGLAGRYALAIFDLAQEQRAVESVAADFTTLKQLMAESPELTRLVRERVDFTPAEMAATLGRLTDYCAAILAMLHGPRAGVMSLLRE